MTTSDTPKVSVIMSVYNGEKYLREAVKSILIPDPCSEPRTFPRITAQKVQSL